MKPFIFGPIEHIALLGASPLFSRLLDWGKAKSVKITIVTSPDQASSLVGLDPIVVEKLTSELRPHLKRLSLALSFGARWLMKEPIRQELFYDQVVNCHGTRLPFDRGGGNWSYRALRGDRIGCLMLHKIDDGIDTGPVLAAQEYVIPRVFQTPAQVRVDYLDRLFPFLTGFLERGLRKSVSLEPQPIPTYLGSYYPRLHTQTHSWIDWSMRPSELERFILAFDEPYAGAMTLWNGKPVHLRSCQLHGGEARTHDGQSGTVMRKGERFLVVALRDGWSLIVESVVNEDGCDVVEKVREGDRFGLTAEARVSVGPTGFKKP